MIVLSHSTQRWNRTEETKAMNSGIFSSNPGQRTSYTNWDLSQVPSAIPDEGGK
jgi:hypothetical protein